MNPVLKVDHLSVVIIALADNLPGRNESIYGQRCEIVP
jgi:hypothetical protein